MPNEPESRLRELFAQLPTATKAVEERALAEGLGDDYRNYMRRTKRLIPWIC